MTEQPLDPQTPEPELAERLGRERPVPGAAFRGALGRYLVAHDPGYGTRPPRLPLIVAAYVAAGLLVMAVGLLLATGT
jgi:hypothetical protein